MKKCLFPLLLGALLLAPGTAALQADSPSATKPLVVVSLAGYDALKAQVAYVGKLTDNPELATGLEALIKLVTKSRDLEGLDKSRPWGAAFFTDGEKKSGYAFLPITDLHQLYEALKPMLGVLEETSEGVYKISKDGKTTFVRVTDGWAFLADHAEFLADLPADPLQMLGDLPKQYAFAVRLIAANAPQQQREALVEQLKAHAAREMNKRPAESDEEYALRKQISEKLIDVWEKLVNNLQEVTLGFALDPEHQKSYLDLSLTGKEGSPSSPIAQASASLKETQSQFAGFRLPEATLSGNWAGKMPPFKSELLEQIIQTVRRHAIADIEKKEHNPDKAETAKKLVEQVTALLFDTLKSGRADGGLAVLLKPDAVTILTGGYVANDGRLEELLQTLYRAAKADNPAVADWVKFNADQCQGVQLHTLSLPIPPDAKDREKVVSLVGETLEIVVGTGKDCIYVAAGRQPLKILKQVIESSAVSTAKILTPVSFSLDVRQLAEFLAAEAKERDRPLARRIAEELKKSPETDHILLTLQSIPHGVKYRLEMESGVQRLLCRWILDRMLQHEHPGQR